MTLLAVILLHNAAYAATFPMARMSVQVYPALAYLAGAGAAALIAERRQQAMILSRDLDKI